MEVPSIKKLYKTYSKNNLQKKGPGVDELWYSRLVGRKLSIYCTWIFLHLGWSPNQVTFLSLLFAFIGCYLISIPNLWSLILGVVLFNIYIILDSSDGEIARIKKQTSILGKYLDRVFHVFIYIFLYNSLGINIYNRTHNIVYILLGVFTSLMMTLASLIYYQDPILEKGGYKELKKGTSSTLRFLNLIYNIITGDIEITMGLLIIAPLQYLEILHIDIFLLVLTVNSVSIFSAGILYNLFIKIADPRYRIES